MKKFILLLAATLIVIFVKAQGGLLCSQETLAGDNADTGYGQLNAFQYANHLTIDANGIFTLNSIKFNALVNPGIPIDGVKLHFYKDSHSGIGPGNEIGSTVMLIPTSVDLGDHLAFSRMEVNVDLEEPFTFIGSDTEIVYWISVIIDYTGNSSFMEVIYDLNTLYGIYHLYDETWTNSSDVFGYPPADGVISFYGECVTLDCIEIEANIGDSCEKTDGEAGTVDANCECVVDVLNNINNPDGFNFTMYPNPATRNGFLTLVSNQSIDRYEVLDITGKALDGNTFSNQNEIEIVLNNYSTGLYILKAYSGSFLSTQKIIVH